ncbi:MAG: amidohydrolase family protein [Bacteroidetes bacterium]|nr:amidohydrolase family protein [Bacteroidota bacterium]
MKKTLWSCLLSVALLSAGAQEVIYPAKEFKGKTFITNGTIHVGNGTVIENGTIVISNGKITSVGASAGSPGSDARVIDAKGKHVYPGLILANTDIGLKEIANGVRGSNDHTELGEFNSNIRAITAYNTDSRVMAVLRSNGILLANVAPQGGSVSGSSTIVQLDAWNWEDAAYQMDAGMHITLPSFISRGGGRRFGGFPGMGPGAGGADAGKSALEKVEEIKSFFRQAKAYMQEPVHSNVNLKLEAMRPLMEKKQKLFVHGDQIKQMLIAIDFAKEFGVDVVIVGGSESFQIADLLKANNISVILDQCLNLPATEDDDIDQPFKTPAALQKAGVLYCISDDDDNTRYRNLSYNAGIAATFGLTKEEALSAITLNAAKILGVEGKTGSIEVGKDANIVVSEGDLLDMKSSTVTDALIQGRQINLDNKQKQLYERYKYKYSLK